MADLQDWGYENGSPYRFRQADSANDYLDAAIRAGRYIDRFSHRTADGLYWLVDDADGIGKSFLMLSDDNGIPLSVYDGEAGICYFFLKLYEVTGRDEYRQTVADSVDYIAKHWRETAAEANAETVGTDTFRSGTFAGVGGLTYVLSQVYGTLGDERSLQTLNDIVDLYDAKARYDEGGAHWSGVPSPSADGGIILMLLDYQRVFPTQRIDDLLHSAGEWFLRHGGDPDTNGFTFGPSFSLPNFEGTAGCGYILLKLFEFTGDERYLSAGLNIESHLRDKFTEQSRGRLLPFREHPDGSLAREPEGAPICYLGLCNGPAGTAKFYYELYRVTGDASHLQTIHELFDGLEALHAPEKQSPGFWNNVSYCCGHAGVLQTLIGLYAFSHEEKWHDLMVRTASVLLGQSESRYPGTLDWPEAFERVKPEIISRDIGFFPGAAGIGTVLLQMYLSETGKLRWKRWPDDPFPESDSSDSEFIEKHDEEKEA